MVLIGIYQPTDSSNLGANNEWVPATVGNDSGIPSTHGEGGYPKLTITDLINSLSLDSIIHKKKVTSLAQGLASLDAGGILGVTQTLSGDKIFEQQIFLDVALQAKGIGADIGLVDANGSPVAMFTSEGDAYVRADSTIGPYHRISPDLDETRQPIPAGDAEKRRGGGLMQNLFGTAALMRGFAGGATFPVQDFYGFYTTELPYTSLPRTEMVGDGSILFFTGQMFTGVSIPLSATPFSLVAIQQNFT